MYELAQKRDQHAAALTYLDTGTLALADILAAIDDEPSEGTAAPNDTHKSRTRRRLAPWAAITAALVAAATVSTLALATPASAASPFDDPAYTALHNSSGWQCVQESRREQSCTSLDGSVHSEVSADEGPNEITFETTYTAHGKTTHTEITSIHTYDAAALSLRAAMRDNPDAYPNAREGAGWLLWSTDETSADDAAAALRTSLPTSS